MHDQSERAEGGQSSHRLTLNQHYTFLPKLMVRGSSTAWRGSRLLGARERQCCDESHNIDEIDEGVVARVRVSREGGVCACVCVGMMATLRYAWPLSMKE